MADFGGADQLEGTHRGFERERLRWVGAVALTWPLTFGNVAALTTSEPEGTLRPRTATRAALSRRQPERDVRNGQLLTGAPKHLCGSFAVDGEGSVAGDVAVNVEGSVRGDSYVGSERTVLLVLPVIGSLIEAVGSHNGIPSYSTESREDS